MQTKLRSVQDDCEKKIMEIREKERRGQFWNLPLTCKLSLQGWRCQLCYAAEEGKQDECQLLKLEIGKMKERERSYKAQVEKVRPYYYPKQRSHIKWNCSLSC